MPSRTLEGFEIGDGALQGRKPAGVRRDMAIGQRHRPAQCLLIGCDAVEQRGDVDALRRLALAQATQIVERGFDHRLHVVDVTIDLGTQAFVIHQFGAQTQARERRTQVVRNGGERPASRRMSRDECAT
jgi:hypothetical protein